MGSGWGHARPVNAGGATLGTRSKPEPALIANPSARIQLGGGQASPLVRKLARHGESAHTVTVEADHVAEVIPANGTLAPAACQSRARHGITTRTSIARAASSKSAASTTPHAGSSVTSA